MAPFGKDSGPLLFEDVAAAEIALVDVDPAMYSRQPLQGLNVPEPRHRHFPPSKRLMRRLHSTVKPAPAFILPKISEHERGPKSLDSLAADLTCILPRCVRVAQLIGRIPT